MSLLEDIFLHDEANEAEELERVIEGDELEDRRRSDSDENSEKEDEAEEDKRRVDPTKTKTTRVVKNPRFLLNPARLTGPRGIQVIPEHFKDFKFKGKGYEKEDLDLVLKKLEHWAYRLYPKFQFEDCLKKIEMLGKKRPVAVHLHKIRSDQILLEDTVVQNDSSDEDTQMPVQEEDEFDKLLQQQIELARSTPVPNSAKKPAHDVSLSPKDKRITTLMMPKVTSSPSINDEQRERMLRSRKLAEERRLARLKNAVNTNNTDNSRESILVSTKMYATHVENGESNKEINEQIHIDTDEISISKNHNRLNVIDSSDEETVVETCMSITVDVHTPRINNKDHLEGSEKLINLVVSGDTEHENIVDDKEGIEKTTSDSQPEVNVDEGLLTDNKNTEEESDNVDHNMTPINARHSDENLTFTKSSQRNDVLGYNNSSMNIHVDENNLSAKNTENITHDLETEGNIDSKDYRKRLDKQELCSTVAASSIERNSDSVPKKNIHDAKHINNDQTESVSEDHDIAEDMDVDFSEDF